MAKPIRRRKIDVYATELDRALDGLFVGQLCVCEDTGKIYKAINETVWQEVTGGGGGGTAKESHIPLVTLNGEVAF